MRKIEQIVANGVVYKSDEAINLFRPLTKEFHESRMTEKEDNPRCNLCGMPVMFSSNGITRYIKHKPLKKEVKCPWHTKVKLTREQAMALKYNGTKEGEKHIKYKNFLFNVLKKDDRFSQEALEKRQVVSVDSMIKWRQPDVSAVYLDKIEIAFEIQLQTILITAIKGRRAFYKEKKAFMLWFFEDREIKKYRYSDGDIFFTNNQNGFFINEKAIALSEKYNKLIVGVKYYDYVLDENNEIQFESKSKFIGFEEIVFDEKTREVYYFDCRAKKRSLKDEIFINTPVNIGEIFQYDGVEFKLLKAKSGSLHIHYKNDNGAWRGGKYHDFFRNSIEAKKHIVHLSRTSLNY